METTRTTYRFTTNDKDRIAEMRLRYCLKSDTDAIRMALILALRQHVFMSEKQIAKLLR